jgi:hypothetical protein
MLLLLLLLQHQLQQHNTGLLLYCNISHAIDLQAAHYSTANQARALHSLHKRP